MRIQVLGGPDTMITPFVFPDGQRHVTLESDIEHSEVFLSTALRSADDLFDLLLVKDILDFNKNRTHLRIEYLLGARMDRRIGKRHPLTLQVVAGMINSTKWESINILDPHSDVALELVTGACAIYPIKEFRYALQHYRPDRTAIIVPDMGAVDRVDTFLEGTDFEHVVQCYKERDKETGKILAISIEYGADVKDKTCLIVDDICDGGATFTVLSSLLRSAGATSVDLFVTHGLFTKGLPLPGIDFVYTADSKKTKLLEGVI